MRTPVIAVLACLSFACTTVRAPAGSLGAPVEELAPAVAQPQVELWIESGKPITPEEQREAEAQARAALAAALANREIAPDALGAEEPLLVVRARGVVRTPSRRSDQRAATVGMVVGFVVVVAAVVILVVTSRRAPRPDRVAPPARGAAASGRALVPTRVRLPARGPVVAPPRPVLRPAPVPGVRPAPAPAPYRPYRGYGDGSGVDVFIGFQLVFPLGPPPPPVPYPNPPTAPYEADGGWTDEAAPPSDAAPTAPEESAQAPTVEILLPALPEVPVDERGFFDGETAIVGLDLVDRRTGQVLWSRLERSDVDPRDAKAMRALVERALAGQRWVRAAPP